MYSVIFNVALTVFSIFLVIINVDFQTVFYTLFIYFSCFFLVFFFDVSNSSINIKIYNIVFCFGSIYISLCYGYMVENSYDYLLSPDIGSYFLPKTIDFLQYNSLIKAQIYNWSDFDFFGRNHVGYFSYLIPFIYLAEYFDSNYYVSMQYSTLIISCFSGVLISKLIRLNGIDSNKSYRYTLVICLFSTVFVYSTQLLRDILVMFLYLLGIYYTFNRKITVFGMLWIFLIIFYSCTLRIETGLFLMVLIPIYFLSNYHETKLKGNLLFWGIFLFLIIFFFLILNLEKILNVLSNNNDYYLVSDKGSGVVGALQKIPLAGNILSIFYNVAQPLPFWYVLEVPPSDNRPEIYNVMNFPFITASFLNWLVLFGILVSLFVKKIRIKVYSNISKILLYHLIAGFGFLYMQASVIDQRRLMAYYVLFYVLFFIIMKYTNGREKRGIIVFSSISYILLHIISSLFKI